MDSIIKLAIVALAGTAAAVPNPEPKATPKPSDCTTTVTYLDAGFTGDWKPTTTITLYDQTVTAPKPTDCHGCNHITTTTDLAPFWGGIGPQIPHVVYIHATVPTTVTSLVCATSTSTPAHNPKPQATK